MFEIDDPVHGAVLHRRLGEETPEGLKVTVRGRAPMGDRVAVNGREARRRGDGFEAEVVLRERETEIVAASPGPSGNREHRIRVLYDRGSRPRYRFSIDDNSFFLRDIARNGYASLFDCFYPGMLRDLNREYGARFVLNIYYETEDGFDMTQFSDRYRGEWTENAGWLKLAFHARANQPDRPYQYAPAEKIIADWDRVDEQIVRFAGEEALSSPTVIHWGMTPRTALKALHDRGIRALSGIFAHRGGAWDIHYHLDDRRSEYLSRHDALMDFDSGIAFSRIDLICNSTPVEGIVPTLASRASDPANAEVMDLFTHEQYFWPFYRNYLPDHAQRLDTAIRWVTERGYAPVFFHEGFLGV